MNLILAGMEYKTKNKTAIILGSSGLIGSHLTRMLLEDERYQKIKIFVRRPPLFRHPKLEVIVTDFSHLSALSANMEGDEMYCCLGTTMKKAGSRKAFEKVDLHLPVQIAGLAAASSVGKFLVVSSIGASEKSGSFYLRTKGKMEKSLMELPFRHLAIFRPSLLLGERSENRIGEDMGKALYKLFGFLFRGPLAKYKAIEAQVVAKAMIRVANNMAGQKIYESDEIQKLFEQRS